MESLESFISKVSGEGVLSPERKRQLGDVLKASRAIMAKRRDDAKQTLDEMEGARSREDVLKASRAGRDRIVSGEQPASGGQQSAPPPPPKPGELVDGYRFRGGNPADKANWVKQ